jgi:hypothetical protein
MRRQKWQSACKLILAAVAAVWLYRWYRRFRGRECEKAEAVDEPSAPVRPIQAPEAIPKSPAWCLLDGAGMQSALGSSICPEFVRLSSAADFPVPELRMNFQAVDCTPFGQPADPLPVFPAVVRPVSALIHWVVNPLPRAAPVPLLAASRVRQFPDKGEHAIPGASEEMRRPTSKPAPAPDFEGFRTGSSFRLAATRSLRYSLRLADGLLSFLLAPFVHRRLRWVTALLAAVLVFWGFRPARSAAESALETAERPLRQRAAFAWEDRFDAGWIHSSAFEPGDTGAVRVQGLALHSRTMGLNNYEMNFSAKIDKKSIGWIVCAADYGNYLAFKLVERGRSAEGLKFVLVRYRVSGGQAPAAAGRQAAPVVILSPRDDFLDISVRVNEQHVLTMVNGFGVDTCQRPPGKAGGLGFLAENGESFWVKSLTISGNEDSLGLFLRSARETLQSIRKTL